MWCPDGTGRHEEHHRSYPRAASRMVDVDIADLQRVADRIRTVFHVFRPALLPEDLRYLGGTLAEVYAAAPGLVPWLRRVFTSWVDSCRQRGFLRDGSSWTRRGAAEGQLESFSL